MELAHLSVAIVIVLAVVFGVRLFRPTVNTREPLLVSLDIPFLVLRRDCRDLGFHTMPWQRK